MKIFTLPIFKVKVLARIIFFEHIFVKKKENHHCIVNERKTIPSLFSVLRDFLERCLEVDVDLRASSHELLNHPFLDQSAELRTLVPYIKVAKRQNGKA